MGFGDPYHEHPLIIHRKPIDGANCVRCELSIPSMSYGCERCNYFIHGWCWELPKSLRHPLHDEHPLTLLPPPYSDLCSECHNPCFGYVYHCSTCQFFLHLKCSFTLKHKKHEHPLRFMWQLSDGLVHRCGMCGHVVQQGYNFTCMSCKFYIHHQCTLIPKIIKHHHVHELTLSYDFPEETEQVYCDRCEGKDGELNRSLSYYFCKRCDYIAHVHFITQPKEDAVVSEQFSRISCLVKHSFHQEHDLTFEGEPYDASSSYLKCMECDFSLDPCKFIHPYHTHYLWFSSSQGLFRCNCCGELGEGFRMQCRQCDLSFHLHLECYALPGTFQHESHPQHPLLLTSTPSQVLLPVDVSRYCNVCEKEIDRELWIYYCQHPGCNYIAHLNCVASNLLSTLQSSIKNQPDFCAIIEWEETTFKPLAAPKVVESPYIETVQENISRSQSPAFFIFEQWEKFEQKKGDDGHPVAKWWYDSEQNGDDAGHSDASCGVTVFGLEEYGDTTLDLSLLNVDEHLADLLHCPKCKKSITTQANSSSIHDWRFNHDENYNENRNIITVGYQRPRRKKKKVPASAHPDPFTLLNEELIDELYCPICNLLIFPPSYSCSSCQIFFHKSCAELPLKYTGLKGHTFALVELPTLSSSGCVARCFNCRYQISGYAYLCSNCGTVFDIQCALGAPLMNHMDHEHILFCGRSFGGVGSQCRACRIHIGDGLFYFKCVESCFNYVHYECALLPPVVKHRIHQHPLGLATNLYELDCEYICDACEKDLNPNLWAYRCLDSCGGYATSHVTCVIASKKKCHFRYEDECRGLTERQKLEFACTSCSHSNDEDDNEEDDDREIVGDGPEGEAREKLSLREEWERQRKAEKEAQLAAQENFWILLRAFQ